MAAAASNRRRKLAKAFLDHWNACLAGIEAEHLSCARRMHPVAAGISSHHPLVRGLLDTGSALVYRVPVSNPVVSVSPDVMSGAPVFPGTRVPVQTPIEYLEAGDSIDEFLAGFPSVSRSQVIAFLERATILAVTDAA
jgi:uncharacterized protein (DUF433 family)